MWLQYGKYMVSEYGEIKNTKSGRILKPWDRGNYKAVNIGINNKQIVHKIVAELFLPRTLDTYTEIDHIDRNKHNNSAHNLRWVSKTENQKNRNPETKPRKNNSLNELYISKYGCRFRVYIHNDKMKVDEWFENINDAISYRNKIRDEYIVLKNSV